MNVTLVKPNAEHGNAATRIAGKVRDRTRRSLRRGRPPKSQQNGYELPTTEGTEQQQTYEQARTEEVSIRALLYRLKLGRQKGELLDRKLLVAELTAMFVAIREIILGSKMAQREKEGLLRQLASIPIVLTSTSVDQPLARKYSIHA